MRSQRNDRYYIGSTNDPERRINEHVQGKSKYTKNNRPFVLVHLQEYTDLRTARIIERKLKKLSSRKIVEKIISEGKIKLGL